MQGDEEMSKLIIICMLIAAVVVIATLGTEMYQQEYKEDVDNDCKNFNGKSFLLTGGSQTPVGIENITREAIRLNWLCGGGK